MTASEAMPRSALSTQGQEERHPNIPTRSSSISRANGTLSRDGPNTIAMRVRHDRVEGRRCQNNLLNSEIEPKSATTALSPTDRKAHQSSRMDDVSSSCSVPSRSSTELAQVQRWAGLTRSVCNWDGLRKVSTDRRCCVLR
jgi:hypothetical protein